MSSKRSGGYDEKEAKTKPDEYPGRVRGKAKPMKSGIAAPTWLRAGARERGQAEVGGKETNPRINAFLQTCSNISRAWIKLKGDSIPWCSAFVNWCLIQAGYAGTNHALARSWVDWGFPAGLVTEAPLGAVLVLERKGGGPDKRTGSGTGQHVTFLTGVKRRDGRLLVRGFGGNQRNRVRSSWYDLTKDYDVLAVRWPWNLADIPQDPPRK